MVFKPLGQSRRHGVFRGLSPQAKLQAPQNWNMKHYKIMEIFKNLYVNPPARTQSPLLTTFWQRFCIWDVILQLSAVASRLCLFSFAGRLLHHSILSSDAYTLSCRCMGFKDPCPLSLMHAVDLLLGCCWIWNFLARWCPLNCDQVPLNICPLIFFPSGTHRFPYFPGCSLDFFDIVREYTSPPRDSARQLPLASLLEWHDCGLLVAFKSPKL